MSKKEILEKQQDAAIDQSMQNAELALSRTEQFFEDNQKPILIGFFAVLVLALVGWFYKTQYYEPLTKEAQDEMFNAQYYFEADSFKLALDGDGMNSGFLKIIDEYKSTPAGKLAKYYAGVCYLRLGDFNKADEMLSSFSSDDEILNSNAVGLCGDAQVELGNLDKAVSLYNKAVGMNNKLTAPIYLMKLGAVYEKQGNMQKAVDAYAQVKEKYPQSSLVSTATKYLESVKK